MKSIHKLSMLQIIQAINTAKEYAELHFDTNDYTEVMALSLRGLIEYLEQHGFKLHEWPNDEGKLWYQDE